MREDIIYGIIGETLRGLGCGLRLEALATAATFDFSWLSCLMLMLGVSS